MEKEIIIKDESGVDITISIVGEFKIDDLNKEFIIYSIVDNDDASTKGQIIIGEVIRDNDNLQVLGIKEDERDLVLAFYNEISEQLGNGDE